MKASVIIPVYNTEKYLDESLACIENQTEKDIEIICIDDASTDGSLAILESHAAKDSRIKIVRLDACGGAGAARNVGLEHASGEYLYFFDSDDLCEPTLLQETIARAEETNADIVAFDYTRFTEDGTATEFEGMHASWLDDPEATTFNYKNCPGRIMGVINPTPWDKLYRASYVKSSDLRFDEITSTNDITFAAVSVAKAERIAFIKKPLLNYRVGQTGTISSTKHTRLGNVIKAVESALAQVETLPYADEISKSINKFAIDNYTWAYQNCITDFDLPVCKEYYEHIHAFFNEPRFDDMAREDIKNNTSWVVFRAIRKQDYATMKELRSKRMVVSVTTFPARIGTLAITLESIYTQTRPADEVVLWLAEEQFPEKENELPADLLALKANGKLTIKWCDDLRPHKKYFYALQEYKDDLVVTIDDDLLYKSNMLEKLFNSYTLYPDAISAVRTHLIIMNEQNEILPYGYWIRETNYNLFEPSTFLFATSGAGTLFPPGLMPPETFDKEAVVSTCLNADDLWLKTMMMLAGIPVVCAYETGDLTYVPGTQDVALWKTNISQGANDDQLDRILAYLESKGHANVWLKKLTDEIIGDDCRTITVLAPYYKKRLERLRKSVNKLEARTTNLKEKLLTTRNRLKTYKKKVATLEEQLAARDKELAEVKAALSSHTNASKNEGKLASIFKKKK